MRRQSHRALQENKINRIGGDKDIKVDVRILQQQLRT